MTARNVAIKEYAAEIGKSVGTARRVLEAKRQQGTASLKVTWVSPMSDKGCRLNGNLPPLCKVNVYTIED